MKRRQLSTSTVWACTTLRLGQMLPQPGQPGQAAAQGGEIPPLNETVATGESVIAGHERSFP